LPLLNTFSHAQLKNYLDISPFLRAYYNPFILGTSPFSCLLEIIRFFSATFRNDFSQNVHLSDQAHRCPILSTGLPRLCPTRPAFSKFFTCLCFFIFLSFFALFSPPSFLFFGLMTSFRIFSPLTVDRFRSPSAFPRTASVYLVLLSCPLIPTSILFGTQSHFSLSVVLRLRVPVSFFSHLFFQESYSPRDANFSPDISVPG